MCTKSHRREAAVQTETLCCDGCERELPAESVKLCGHEYETFAICDDCAEKDRKFAAAWFPTEE